MYFVALDGQTVVDEYLAGTNMLRIAKKYGVSRHAVWIRLRDAQIPIRTMSEQKLLDNALLDASEKQQWTMAAHDALRGSKRPIAQSVRRAATREIGYTMSHLERRANAILLDAGFAAKPEMAVGLLNVDLAFPDLFVAVEVDGSWHYTAKKKAQDARKAAYLHALGWPTLRVYFTANGHPHGFAETIAELERRSRLPPSAFDKERMLWGRFQQMISNGEYNKIATVDALVESLHGAPPSHVG